MLGTRENGTDFSHALCPASNTGALDTFVCFWLKFFSFPVLHTFKHTAWTGRAAGSWMLCGIFTMNNTTHLRLCDHALLALSKGTRLSWALPLEGAVVGSSFMSTTFASLTAGAPLLNGQRTVPGQHRALLPLTSHLFVRAHTHYARVVCDKWNLEDLPFIFTFCNRPCQEGGSQRHGDPGAIEQQQDAAGNPRRASARTLSQSPDAGEPEHRHLEGIPGDCRSRVAASARRPLLAVKRAVGRRAGRQSAEGGGRPERRGRSGGAPGGGVLRPASANAAAFF